jgi:hypothetical protein
MVGFRYFLWELEGVIGNDQHERDAVSAGGDVSPCTLVCGVSLVVRRLDGTKEGVTEGNFVFVALDEDRSQDKSPDDFLGKYVKLTVKPS